MTKRRDAIQPTLTLSHSFSSSGSKVTDSHLQQLHNSDLHLSPHLSAFLTFTCSLFLAALLLVAAASNHFFLSFLSSLSVLCVFCLSVPPVTSQPVALPSLKPPAWPGPMPSPRRMQPAVLIGWRAGGCPHIWAGRGGAAKGGEVEEITKFVT